MFEYRERLGPAGSWVIALVFPLAAAAVMIAVRAHTQASNLALIMVVVVALSVVPGRRLPAVAAGLSAGVWFDFFLTRPYEQLSIQRSADIQTTVLLTVVAIVVGEIAARRRHARKVGRLARDEVVGLYVVAQMLSAGSRPRAVVDAVAEQLKELLDLAGCAFDSEPGASVGPWIDRAGEVEDLQSTWSVARDGLPPGDVSLPVDSAGRPVGRYVLRAPQPGVPLGLDRLLAAVALSDLAGAALGEHGLTRSS